MRKTFYERPECDKIRAKYNLKWKVRERAISTQSTQDPETTRRTTVHDHIGTCGREVTSISALTSNHIESEDE